MPINTATITPLYVEVQLQLEQEKATTTYTECNCEWTPSVPLEIQDALVRGLRAKVPLIDDNLTFDGTPLYKSMEPP